MRSLNFVASLAPGISQKMWRGQLYAPPPPAPRKLFRALTRIYSPVADSATDTHTQTQTHTNTHFSLCVAGLCTLHCCFFSRHLLLLSNDRWSLILCHVSDEENLHALTDSLNLPSLTLDAAPISMAGLSVKAEDIVLGTATSMEDGLLLWALCHTVFCMTSNKTGNVLLQFVHRTCLRIKARPPPAGAPAPSWWPSWTWITKSDDSRYVRLRHASGRLRWLPVKRAGVFYFG